MAAREMKALLDLSQKTVDRAKASEEQYMKEILAYEKQYKKGLLSLGGHGRKCQLLWSSSTRKGQR